MNKLLIEKEDLRRKARDLCTKILTLRNFINTAEKIFMNNESKMAITRIKEYLDDMTKELNLIDARSKKLKDEIDKNCKHEILCNNGGFLSCAICHKFFSKDDINFECLIVDKREINTSFQIENIILNIAKRNGDILQEFEDIVFENYENILVRRKTR